MKMCFLLLQETEVLTEIDEYSRKVENFDWINMTWQLDLSPDPTQGSNLYDQFSDLTAAEKEKASLSYYLVRYSVFLK